MNVQRPLTYDDVKNRNLHKVIINSVSDDPNQYILPDHLALKDAYLPTSGSGFIRHRTGCRFDDPNISIYACLVTMWNGPSIRMKQHDGNNELSDPISNDDIRIEYIPGTHPNLWLQSNLYEHGGVSSHHGEAMKFWEQWLVKCFQYLETKRDDLKAPSIKQSENISVRRRSSKTGQDRCNEDTSNTGLEKPASDVAMADQESKKHAMADDLTGPLFKRRRLTHKDGNESRVKHNNSKTAQLKTLSELARAMMENHKKLEEQHKTLLEQGYEKLEEQHKKLKQEHMKVTEEYAEREDAEEEEHMLAEEKWTKLVESYTRLAAKHKKVEEKCMRMTVKIKMLEEKCKKLEDRTDVSLAET